jgi:hypothetical protein
MKKFFLAAMVLAVLTAGVVFGQGVSPFGSVGANFYCDTTINDGETGNEWGVNILNSSSLFGVRYEGENVFAMAGYRADSVFFASGTWTTGALSVNAGFSPLPCTFGGHLDIFQNGNWGKGITVIAAEMVSISIAGFQAGVAGMGPLDSYSPLLFAAYDYNAESFSAGASFTGWASKLDSPDSAFPFLATVRGRCNIAPVSVGLNAGIYKGLRTLVKSTPLVSVVDVLHNTVAPEDSLVFEGLFDFKFTVNDTVSAAFTAGYIHELAAEDKGGGDNWLQLGFEIPISLGNGFTVTPGLVYVNELSENIGGKIENEKKSEFQYGVTLKYSF